MDHCHHATHSLEPIIDLFAIEGSGLIIAAFINGLAISLSHCMGMCGPFALMQLNLQLMPSPITQLTQTKKLRLALFMPYYLGKGVTYCFLTSLLYYVSDQLTETPAFHIVTGSIVLISGLFFATEALTRITSSHFKMKIGAFVYLTRWLTKLTNRFNLNTFKRNGLVAGVLLGFIPCGPLYATLTSIAMLSPSWHIALLAAGSFAIATIPGLFLTAYLGSYCISKWKRYFSWTYTFIMLLNASLLLKYAWRLLASN